MRGIFNRSNQSPKCEVGTCDQTAFFTEEVFLAPNPGSGAAPHECVINDIVLCPVHEREFQHNKLAGTFTAYGDTIMLVTRLSALSLALPPH